ncbi:competence protein ComK [Staphylococcus sp. 17KM0847]|uniref:competence protein ComK n=1 Tax=Staphylococcus sp. 17KM0847 TaxID=2583989 RepID=UPI0015DF1ADC|nr:competence protein ComK [Staphylococcus sp. 17KM0847]
MHQYPRVQHTINQHIMLIKPINGPEGTYTRTEILYSNGKKVIKNMRPARFIEYACRYRHNTYHHIKAEVKLLTGISSKPPIFIPNPQAVTFFSTHSDRIPQNCWVNVDYVQKIEDKKDGKSKIILHSGHCLTVEVSQYTLLHQYQNGIQLAYALIRQDIKSGELVKKYDKTQHDELVSVIREFVSTFREMRLALTTDHWQYKQKIAEDPPFKNY